MKRFFLFFALVFAALTTSFAQSTSYKAFKVDVGGLYAIPSGDGIKAGVGFYLEPKYNINDNIALGLKMEWALMGASDKLGSNASVSTLGTYQLTGDYYFNTNKIRPFAGLGLGIYNLGTVEFSANLNETDDAITINGDPIDYGSKFGFTPRVGLLMGHFRVALEYNAIMGVDDVLDSKNYLSFKLGFEIGGGKK